MSTVAQTITILGGLAALLSGHLYMLTRYFDARFSRVDSRLGRLEGQLTRVEAHAER